MSLLLSFLWLFFCILKGEFGGEFSWSERPPGGGFKYCRMLYPCGGRSAGLVAFLAFCLPPAGAKVPVLREAGSKKLKEEPLEIAVVEAGDSFAGRLWPASEGEEESHLFSGLGLVALTNAF